MNIYSKRIDLLKAKVKYSAFLITEDKNIYYFTGLWDSNGYLFVTRDNAYLLVDFRYGEIAEKTVKSAKVIVFSKLYEEINKLAENNCIKSCYCETHYLTISRYQQYSEKLKFKIFQEDYLDLIIDDFRILKDDQELIYMKKAQEITEQAYYNVLPMVKAGTTEKEISLELEHQIKLLGGDDVSFDLITITGKNTSLPHGVPSNTKIRKGDFFTFDIGATYKGYHSDMTRTVCIGEPDDEMKKVYNIVLDAHKKALSSVKPGMKCCEIDKLARDYIYSNGYKGCFGHSTGHGVGLDIHENPTVGGNCETVLKEGMVITIEPGIYIKDKFGVRIEDSVFVTSDGCKSFATIPKELTIL